MVYNGLCIVCMICRQCFLFALKYTPSSQKRNCQRILASLVPVQMCLGVMPSEGVGRVYGFHDFVRMGRAVVNGDLKTYEEVSPPPEMAYTLSTCTHNTYALSTIHLRRKLMIT